MKTVLLIEDNEMIRETTAELLEMAHYNVLEAENGKKGVELALHHPPDIVVCDIMMPIMDGYSVLHIFGKNPDLETIPFIFLSAKTERAEIRKGMESGADDYITKPFYESELLTAIESRLRKVEVLKKDVRQPEDGNQYPWDTAKQYQELESLALDKKVYFYKRKQLLYLEGNEAAKLFFIKKGKVKTYQSNPEGKELITTIFKEGEFLGYLPLIMETDYQDTAEALEDSEIVVIPKEDFTALLYQNQYIAKHLIKLLANSVTEKEKSLSGMAYNSLRKRTAETLLFLQTKYQTDPQLPSSIQISRDDIAHLIGSSTESLIRTLSDFKNEQLIDIVDGKIVILDEHKLQNMRN